MFEQTFKNIDDVLWKEAGCATELDYTEQTLWLPFLKYLDDLERTNEQKAELRGKQYQYLLDKPHRWSAWAAPKKRDGSFDHDKSLTGDDLIDFVNRDLFPYLQGFKTRATSADTIEYKIGEIFGEIKNKFQSGYSLRDALELVDALSFRSSHVVKGLAKKSRRSTSAVIDALADLRPDDLHHGADQRARRVVFAAVPSGIAHVAEPGLV